LLSQTRSGAISYFLQDGQSSTRALTDNTGAITDTYSYTAFGELQSQSGSTTNSYLYTGQQFDSLTGLYDLRARYYNPGLGRFLSQDTYPVNFGSPLELNRYAYTANNPINAMDPSGHNLVEYLGTQIVKVGAATTAVYFFAPRAYTMLAYYVSQLAPYSADEISSFVSIMQFTGTQLASGWDGGWGGGGGGNNGGDNGWDDLDFPEPGDPNGEGRHKGEVRSGRSIGGIYEFFDQESGLWYVGESKDLRDRLQFWIRNGNLSGWDEKTLVWTEIDSFRPKARFVAERIRLEQFEQLGVEVDNVDGHTASKSDVIEWFERKYYKDPRIVSNWPDWLTNPWPEE